MGPLTFRGLAFGDPLGLRAVGGCGAGRGTWEAAGVKGVWGVCRFVAVGGVPEGVALEGSGGLAISRVQGLGLRGGYKALT